MFVEQSTQNTDPDNRVFVTESCDHRTTCLAADAGKTARQYFPNDTSEVVSRYIFVDKRGDGSADVFNLQYDIVGPGEFCGNVGLGEPCDDGDATTDNDVCTASGCVGTPQ